MKKITQSQVECIHCGEDYLNETGKESSCPKCGLYSDGSMDYVVNWFYVANHGTELVRELSPNNAIKHVWNGREDIKYVVSEKKTTYIFNSKE